MDEKNEQVLSTAQIRELLESADHTDLRWKPDEIRWRVAQAIAALDDIDSATADQPDSVSTSNHASEDDVRARAILRLEARRLSAVVLMFEGKNADAKEALLLLSEEADARGDDTLRAKVQESLGHVLMFLSDYEQALQSYTQSHALYEKTNNTLKVAKLLRSIGSAHENISDRSTAIDYYTRALQLFEELDYKNGIADSLTSLGNVYGIMAELPKAKEFFAKALTLFEELGNKQGIADTTNNIALIYQFLTDNEKALEYYSKSLSMQMEVGQKVGIANVSANLGVVYRTLNDADVALEHFNRALAIYTELGNKRGIALATTNIGVVQTDRENFTEALEHYARALTIYNQINFKQGIAYTNINIGTVYQRQHDYDHALEYFLIGLEIQEENFMRMEAADTRAMIGNLYSDTAWSGYNQVTAEEYLLQSLALSQELQTTSYNVHRALADLYKSEERWPEYAQHIEKFIERKSESESEAAKKSAKQMEQRRQIAEREKEIAIAKAAAMERLNTTTSLLHKVLPETIASRMIGGEEDIADYFPSVSILFADIAGFTPISAEMPAIVIVRFLNYVFGEFDRIIKKHGCEKIKTIGDGYLAVCGAPMPCEDHAERLTAAAVELLQTIVLPESIRSALPEGTNLGIRIGLHSGAIVAGVIGEERFVYDIYSDAVNTAARMESHGEKNKIHVSSEFYRHLQNRFAMSKNTTHGYVFENRGEIEIKGKGMMRTYFLEKA